MNLRPKPSIICTICQQEVCAPCGRFAQIDYKTRTGICKACAAEKGIAVIPSISNPPPHVARSRFNKGEASTETSKQSTANPPTIGLIIGSCAGVPYIHLHLESWRKLYPQIPLLVHDDHSPQSQELAALCKEYGADFVASPVRRGHQAGDLSVYLHGLEWARDKNLDLLVKMSQRWVPLTNWVPGLQQLAQQSQAATYTDRCRGHHHPFRSECAALHVASWVPFRDRIAEAVEAGNFGIVEHYLHGLAREILQAKDENSEPYTVWPFLGDNGNVQNEQYLWHRAYGPGYYYWLASQFGIHGYTPHNYVDTWEVPYLPKTAASTSVTEGLPEIPLLDKLHEFDCNLPSDINEHLPRLKQLAAQCKHVTELTSRSGESTRALLAGRPTRVCCYDTNSSSAQQGLQRVAEDAGVELRFQHANSLNVVIERTDLLFIDTLHTYKQLAAELKQHAGRVRRFLVLHDTLTFGERGEDGERGLSRAIDEFLQSKPEWAMMSCNHNNNGLIVLARLETKTSTEVPPSGPALDASSQRQHSLIASEKRGTARLGIGLITFNRLSALQGCLEALEKFTKTPYDLVIADDGSTDGTVEWAREQGYRILTGKNTGCAWNKNRALYYLMHQTQCDQILLLEDDCWPQFEGWEAQWMEAARRFGHVNYVTWHETPRDQHIAGQGTAEDPMRCTGFAGTCTINTREALENVGYLDTRFRGYGYEHTEWTWRMGEYLRERLWGEPDPERARHTFPVLQTGVDLIDFGTFRNWEQVEYNQQFLALVEQEPGFRPAFRTPAEKLQLERELEINIPDVVAPSTIEASPPTELCPNPQQWRMYDEITCEVEVLEFMAQLVTLLKPQFVLETGSYLGWSAWYMGQALSRNGFGTLISLENNPHFVGQATHLCHEFPQVEIVHSDSLQYTPAQPIDLLFCDSDQFTVISEIERFLPQLSPRGIVVVHDSSPHKGEPRAGLEALEERGLIKALHLPTPRGLTLIQPK